MFEYRSIPLAPGAETGLWSVQRFENLGTSGIGPQVCGIFADQILPSDSAHSLTAKHLADTAGAAFAGIDGTFSSSNDPFEV